ncbi:MAG: hypothetical protein K8R59_04120 [Thermoanaerobaculales bacterium]|nr:hypothetical protein [Thermoanaerobaculales bacterium]
MKNAVLLCLGLTLLAGCTHPTETWSRYDFSEGRYSIIAPGTMRESTITYPTIHGEIIYSLNNIEFAGVLYSVGHARLPDAVMNGFSKDDLLGMQMIFLAQEGYTQVDAIDTSWQGHPALFSDWDAPNERDRLILRSIYANGFLYRLLVAVEKDSLEIERPYFEAFLDSFEIGSGQG